MDKVIGKSDLHQAAATGSSESYILRDDVSIPLQGRVRDQTHVALCAAIVNSLKLPLREWVS